MKAEEEIIVTVLLEEDEVKDAMYQISNALHGKFHMIQSSKPNITEFEKDSLVNAVVLQIEDDINNGKQLLVEEMLGTLATDVRNIECFKNYIDKTIEI